MVNKYGLADWDQANDADRKTNSFKNDKDTFLKLESGNNVVRVITKPYQHIIHKGYKPNENDAGFGWKVPCSKFNGESCPLCDDDMKTQTKWFIGVIDRKTQGYKVLDITWAIFQGIKTFSQDEDYGPPEGYDIDIKVNPKGGSTGYYTVVPKPKKSLSPADILIKNKVEGEYAPDLLTRCVPPTREKLEERLESIKNFLAKKNGTSVPSAQDNDSDENSNSDEDISFSPPAN